jgi:hypothetical protein
MLNKELSLALGKRVPIKLQAQRATPTGRHTCKFDGWNVLTNLVNLSKLKTIVLTQRLSSLNPKYYILRSTLEVSFRQIMVRHIFEQSASHWSKSWVHPQQTTVPLSILTPAFCIEAQRKS